MTDAYVMLNCELGAEEKIIEQLREIEEVEGILLHSSPRESSPTNLPCPTI